MNYALGLSTSRLLKCLALSVHLLSCIWLFVIPCTIPCQASLSITISWSLFKFMSIELVIPSNHLILGRPFSSCLQSFPASGSFLMSEFFALGGQSIGASASASMNVQDWFSSSEYSGLISFRMDWFDLLAVQGTLKSLQHHSSKASILWHSAFFIVQIS